VSKTKPALLLAANPAVLVVYQTPISSALQQLSRTFLSGLGEPDRVQLQADAWDAFRVWRAHAVEFEHLGLRAGRTHDGTKFSSDADLVLQFVGTLLTTASALAERSKAEIVSALLSRISEPPSPEDEIVLVDILTEGIARQRADRALTRQATRHAPTKQQIARIQEGRRRGGQASKRILGLAEYLAGLLAKTPEASNKELWRLLERYESSQPLHIGDVQIYVEEDRLYWHTGKDERSITYKGFERYAAQARKKMPQ
jgi:hypothetical protein